MNASGDQLDASAIIKNSDVAREPLVITVILNTNRCADTLAAIDSMQKNTYSNHQILVLDNASTDGSVEAIHQSYPSVPIVNLEKNLGYAGNNNVGIEIALNQKADWIFLLNEDTVVAEDCLELLIKTAQMDDRVGVLGPMVYHFDEKNVIQSAGGRIDELWQSWHLGQNETDKGQFSEPHAVDWISGCAILIRREVFEQVGALDQRFFYYWEETELCVRAQRNGWKILQVPQAKIWHKGVQRNYRPGPKITYFNTRNHLMAMSKHHAPLKAWAFTFFQIGRTIITWTIKPKYSSFHEHRSAILQGVTDFFRHRWGPRRQE